MENMDFWMDLYHFALIVLGFALGFVVGKGVGRHSLLRQLFKDNRLAACTKRKARLQELRSGGNGWKVLNRWKSKMFLCIFVSLLLCFFSTYSETFSFLFYI